MEKNFKMFGPLRKNETFVTMRLSVQRTDGEKLSEYSFKRFVEAFDAFMETQELDHDGSIAYRFRDQD